MSDEKKMLVRITGTRPLLMHKPNLKPDSGPSPSKPTPLQPEEEAEQGA